MEALLTRNALPRVLLLCVLLRSDIVVAGATPPSPPDASPTPQEASGCCALSGNCFDIGVGGNQSLCASLHGTIEQGAVCDATTGGCRTSHPSPTPTATVSPLEGSGCCDLSATSDGCLPIAGTSDLSLCASLHGQPVQDSFCDQSNNTCVSTTVPTPTIGAGSCTGDCDGNVSVTVDEILRSVNIALGVVELAECPNADSNDDRMVSVDEIVIGVTMAIGQCS